MAEKVLIIGLDGADWRILQPYINKGLMPNLAGLIERGISGPLRSTIPTNSSVAWSTFMTGRNPGKHAIYDFSQRSPENSRLMVGVNSRTRRTDTFFDALGRHNRKVGAINVPNTYPPFPVNGFMLGGMFVEESKPYTFPEELASELDEQAGGFPVNCIRWRFMLGKFEELVDEAIVVTRQRARVLEYLIDKKEWDVLVQVFVSPDRLQHPLMHILDSEHPNYDADLAQLLDSKLDLLHQTIDQMLGRTLEQISHDTMLMVISDHGFRSVYKAVSIREILAREGLLKVTKKQVSPTRLARKFLRSMLPDTTKKKIKKVVPGDNRQVGSPHEMANVDWSRTQAYVTTRTSQGVYVNLSGREPEGIVAPGDAYERLLTDIQTALLAERDPDNGQPVFESVIRARDLYNGPWLELAPDLLCIPAPGYAFARSKDHLEQYDWFMGDHEMNGIFVASGPGVKSGEKIKDAGLIDIGPTALYLSGVPIPEDMDGQVLNLFDDQRLVTTPPTYEKVETGYEGQDHTYTAEEARQVEEQLRSLGYM